MPIYFYVLGDEHGCLSNFSRRQVWQQALDPANEEARRYLARLDAGS